MEWKISFDEVRYRLELALKPAEPPVLDEVLAAVEKNGRLHGPVDWVFSAWRLYVEYAAQEIAETFQLTEEDASKLPRRGEDAANGGAEAGQGEAGGAV
ncbi:MAG: hypothetical protein RXR02_03445 [Thermoproteus sp.]